MSQKINTIFFLVTATLVNLIIMAVFIIVPFFLYMRFLAPHMPKDLTFIPIIVILVGATIGTYISYNALMRKIATKLDFEKHFDPLIKPFVKKK